MAREIRLVVFDLGRILVRICDGWEHACRVAGVNPPGTTTLDADRTARLHTLVCDSETNAIDLQAFAAGAAPLLGLGRDDVIALSNAYLLGLFPGVERLLDDLTGAGLETACLSNTNSNHWRIMEDPSGPHHAGLSRLTHRFASHLIGARKPDAAIYAHVEQTTRHREGEIVFFDDLPENIEAANGRGWRGIHIAPCQNPISAIRGHLRMLLGNSWTAADK